MIKFPFQISEVKEQMVAAPGVHIWWKLLNLILLAYICSGISLQFMLSELRLVFLFYWRRCFETSQIGRYLSKEQEKPRDKHLLHFLWYVKPRRIIWQRFLLKNLLSPGQSMEDHKHINILVLATRAQSHQWLPIVVSIHHNNHGYFHRRLI